MNLPGKGESVVRPATALIPLYQSRLEHAYFNLRFWQSEYTKHSDGMAESELREARRLVGVLTATLYDLKRPNALIPGPVIISPV